MGIEMLIYLINKYLLSAYHVPGVALRVRDQGIPLHPRGSPLQFRKEENKHVNI